jgi:hypothetical protein
MPDYTEFGLNKGEKILVSFSPGGNLVTLCLAKGKVIAFLAVLDDALQGAVRHRHSPLVNDCQHRGPAD